MGYQEKLGKNADGSQMVGDNFVRASDELEDFKQAQLFAWVEFLNVHRWSPPE